MYQYVYYPKQENGSPPRAWGQFREHWTPGVYRTVHPHGRGDNYDYGVAPAFTYGSPPRAWGQLPVEFPARAILRFTPTGVGTIPHTR